MQVFLQRNIDGAGADRLLFVDMFSGETTSLDVHGQHYTPAGRKILYFDPTADRVMLAAPDGTATLHPFIQPAADTRRIDWILSGDGQKIAWTLTGGTDSSHLVTTTYIANLDGSDLQPILADGPRDGIRVLPVAFSTDLNRLYMDYQPDNIGDSTPFREYAGLFSVDLATKGTQTLPDEPGCFCGAGIGGGLFVRLALTSDMRGFEPHVYNLIAATKSVISGLSLANFTQAGDVLVAPDGSKAVYALAQVRDFGTANQSVRTVFALVDLSTMSETALTQPITTFVRPVAWTEDNTAVLFTSPTADGTWKVSLSDGSLDKIAVATYLGTL